MVETANFLGIGIDSGQKIMGPSIAHHLINEKKLIAFNLLGIKIREPVLQRQHQWHSVNSLEDLQRVDWTPFEEAYLKIYELLSTKRMQINWGGDHSIGISTVAAFLAHYKDGHVIWIDAHADLNLPQHSPTGSLHGMPLAFLLNLEDAGIKNFPWIKNFLNFSNLTYVGIRDLDPFEKNIIETLGIKHFSSEDVKNLGYKQIIEEIRKGIGSAPVHVSFDIDCVDPFFAPATGVQVPNGIDPEVLFSFGGQIGRLLNIKSIDVVEINPLLGSSSDIQKTTEIATQFLFSVLEPRRHINRGTYDGISQQSQELSTT